MSTPEGRIDYDHYATGQLKQIRTSAGQVTTYGWTELGNLACVRSNVFGATDGQSDLCTYEYNTHTGQRTKLVRPNGVETTYEYEPRGWTKTIAHKKTGGDTYLRLDYAREPNGLIKTTRSEERRVGKECRRRCVDLGGRRIIQAEDGIRDPCDCDWSSDVCSSDLRLTFNFPSWSPQSEWRRTNWAGRSVNG